MLCCCRLPDATAPAACSPLLVHVVVVTDAGHSSLTLHIHSTLQVCWLQSRLLLMLLLSCPPAADGPAAAPRSARSTHAVLAMPNPAVLIAHSPLAAAAAVHVTMKTVMPGKRINFTCTGTRRLLASAAAAACRARRKVSGGARWALAMRSGGGTAFMVQRDECEVCVGGVGAAVLCAG